MTFQAISDYKEIFIDADCESQFNYIIPKCFWIPFAIGKWIKKNYLYQKLLSSYCEDPYYTIGIPAYPLAPFYLKGYSHYPNNNEVVFDTMVPSAQNMI